jgi:hypothetical protein
MSHPNDVPLTDEEMTALRKFDVAFDADATVEECRVLQTLAIRAVRELESRRKAELERCPYGGRHGEYEQCSKCDHGFPRSQDDWHGRSGDDEPNMGPPPTAPSSSTFTFDVYLVVANILRIPRAEAKRLILRHAYMIDASPPPAPTKLSDRIAALLDLGSGLGDLRLELARIGAGVGELEHLIESTDWHAMPDGLSLGGRCQWRVLFTLDQCAADVAHELGHPACDGRTDDQHTECSIGDIHTRAASLANAMGELIANTKASTSIPVEALARFAIAMHELHLRPTVS